MNPNEFHQMYKHLIKPSREKLVESAKKELGIPKEAKINNGSEILGWINFNQKMYGNNKMPLTPEEKRIGESIEKKITEVPHDTDPGYIEPKKKIIKKEIKVVEKPKTKPVPISPLPYDWREGIWHDLEDEDPYYNWEPKDETRRIEFEKILNTKKREVGEGIRSILNLHKRST